MQVVPFWLLPGRSNKILTITTLQNPPAQRSGGYRATLPTLKSSPESQAVMRTPQPHGAQIIGGAHPGAQAVGRAWSLISGDSGEVMG